MTVLTQDDGPAVTLVAWPHPAELLHELAANDRPRLLLIPADAAPPQGWDPLEDWIRTPADPEELSVRMATLHRRAEASRVEPPRLDGDGVIRHRTGWLALPPIEAAIVSPLVARFGQVADRASLIAAAWPAGTSDDRILDSRIKLLRRRLEPLGLAIRTVRGRGYILEALPI